MRILSIGVLPESISSMYKKFLTYEQQIEHLQSKGLCIPDKQNAATILEQIGYFPLIEAYKKGFLHKPSGQFLYGVTFDEIVCFYKFDEELRSLFLKYILHIERCMKSLISYYFCEKYGEKQSEYLNPANFNTAKKNLNAVNRLLASLMKTISSPAHHNYIGHYAEKYQNVPLWVTMNAITFGQLSAFYQYMSNDLQVKVSKHFSSCSEKQLHQFLSITAKCRNICAHGERLYDFQTSGTIPDTLLHDKLSISMRGGSYTAGKHDLFAVVIALRYLLPNEEFKTFKNSLRRFMKKVLQECPHITRQELLREMGFPENWDKICRYKIS